MLCRSDCCRWPCRHRRLAVREAWAASAQVPGVSVARFILTEEEHTRAAQSEVLIHVHAPPPPRFFALLRAIHLREAVLRKDARVKFVRLSWRCPIACMSPPSPPPP